MNTGGWKLRLYPKSSTEILIYSDLEGRNTIFVKGQYSSQAVLSADAIQLLDIELHCMTATVKSFLGSCHVLVLFLDSVMLVLMSISLNLFWISKNSVIYREFVQY